MLPAAVWHQLRRMASTSTGSHYKLLVAGGGAGGVSVAAKFGEAMGKGQVAVVEPSDTHYYQPMWTLVGAGIKKLSDSSKSTASVIPKKVAWLKTSVAEFEPEQNRVKLADGKEVSYDYLLVAVGLKIDWDKVKGLEAALDGPDSQVVSNYSPKTVVKTKAAIDRFKEGNAIFTFPNSPVKCPGAPQKIMYLTDAILRQTGRRSKTNIIYNTSLGVIFGAPKYAESLREICKKRDLHVNYFQNLVEVKPDNNEAVFEDVQSKKLTTFKYQLLHVTPPMSSPPVVKPLADQSGFVSVDKSSLQHTKFPNVFAIGDCTNLPTSRTAAAVASQNIIVSKNLLAVMNGKKPYAVYKGYTSCPLTTGFNKCILAEFDYTLQPVETFPLDQSKERKTMFWLKKSIMPRIYWNGLLKGAWNGPGFYRRIFHLGLSK